MFKQLVSNLPRKHVLSLGKLLGVILQAVGLPHRRLVRRNLRFCYPQLTLKERRHLTRRIFNDSGITLLEIFQLYYLSPADLLGMFRVTGEKYLANALRANKGVIIISAHLANWESAFQFTGLYFNTPLTGVARNMKNKWVDQWFYRLRTGFNNKMIFKRGALPQMRQTLRNGEMLGLTIDQSRYKQGVEVMFFDRKATATPAAALLALRCKSPVVPMFCTREPSGQLILNILPPLPMRKTGDLRKDLETNTQTMVDTVEKMIRKYPEQWIWFQRPWKKTYPHLYPEWEARRLRRKQKKLAMKEISSEG
jgi:KDO2-lipid IV(A) lauroyltransferase